MSPASPASGDRRCGSCRSRSQIQPAAAQVVIEQAVADIAALGDGERNMFIQRVSADGVVAHGIEVTHLIAFTGALQVAGLFAQAVKRSSLRRLR